EPQFPTLLQNYNNHLNGVLQSDFYCIIIHVDTCILYLINFMINYVRLLDLYVAYLTNEQRD
ncbi:MAG TPA: hypothetical protein DHN29_06000, partial [Cytophagales bacterium]|nr:hypothetical protein [Cytophagales bacterium]